MNTIKQLFYCIFIFSFVSCNICKHTNKSDKSNNSPIITFQKTACYGKCPVYSLEIFENGLIKFIGEKNIDKIGKYKKTISKKEIKELINSFVNVNFFDFKDEYTSKKTDLPTTYISFSYNGNYKKIRDYSDAPKELRKLEKSIEDIVKFENWEKIE